MENEKGKNEEIVLKNIIDEKIIDENEEDEKWLPEGLLIGSGGARGYLLLGALHRLYAEGYLDKVKYFSGVSVGSILAFLLACGYTPRQIWEEVKELDSKDLMEMSNNFTKLGAFTMRPIEERIVNFIKPRFPHPPSFEELYEKTGNELYITAFNTTTKRRVVFCRQTFPNKDVIKTLCMSSSIPFVFEAFRDGNFDYIDGAMIDSYPLDTIDNHTRKVLGLYIEDYVEEKNVLSKINALLTGNLDGKRIETIEKSGENSKHIGIYSEFLDTTGITVDVSKKVRMMASGDTSIKLWIQEEKERKERRKEWEEKSKYTYLKTVEEFSDDFVVGTYRSIYVESDEEQVFEETKKDEIGSENIDASSFYEHETYNEDFLT